jgi:hypothetical protein
MIDFGDMINRRFPAYGWLLIDVSHIILGYLSGMYFVVFVLFVIYQILDIKKGDNLVRDFLFFGLGYFMQKVF